MGFIFWGLGIYFFGGKGGVVGFWFYFFFILLVEKLRFRCLVRDYIRRWLRI